MKSEIIIAILSTVTTLLVGGGGLFAFLISRGNLKIGKEKQKVDAAVKLSSEWHSLYNEMRERANSQEQANRKLSDEVSALKVQVTQLSIELAGYKRYDHYVSELEGYTTMLMQTLEPLVSQEAFENISARRPQRNFTVDGIHETIVEG